VVRTHLKGGGKVGGGVGGVFGLGKGGGCWGGRGGGLGGGAHLLCNFSRFPSLTVYRGKLTEQSFLFEPRFLAQGYECSSTSREGERGPIGKGNEK